MASKTPSVNGRKRCNHPIKRRREKKAENFAFACERHIYFWVHCATKKMARA